MKNNVNSVIRKRIKNISLTDEKIVTAHDVINQYTNSLLPLRKCLKYREDIQSLEKEKKIFKNRLEFELQERAQKYYACPSNKVSYEYINDDFIIHYYILNEKDNSLHIGKRVYKGFDRFLNNERIPRSEEELFELFKAPYFEYYIDGKKQSKMIKNEDFHTYYERHPYEYADDSYRGNIYDAINYYVITKKIEAAKERNAQRDYISEECEKYLRAFPIKLLNGDYILLENLELNENNISYYISYIINNGFDRNEIVDYKQLSIFLTPKLDKVPADKTYFPRYLKYRTFSDLLDVQVNLDNIEKEYKKFLSEENALTNKEEKNNIEEEKVEKEIEEKKNLDEIKRNQIEELQNLVINTLTSLNELIDESKTPIVKYPIPEELLFSYDNGVKRINEKFIPNLKYLDLSHINFEGIDISGIDFRDCNPSFIDPQVIHNKDLSNTNFIYDTTRVNNSFPFGVNTDFNGVDLSGANFEINEHTFMTIDGAIMDNTTNINYGYSTNKDEKVKKLINKNH